MFTSDLLVALLGRMRGAGLFGVDFVVPHRDPDWLRGTGEGVQRLEACFNGSVAKFSPNCVSPIVGAWRA